MLHRKVQCWIFTTDDSGLERCLVLKTNRARGSFWQPVTGSVEPGEGYFEAACRETVEETGFAFTSPPLDSGFEFNFTSRQGAARERIFALRVDGAPVPRLDPNEHDDFQWLRPREALALLKYPSNADGLKRTHALVFGTTLDEKDSA